MAMKKMSQIFQNVMLSVDGDKAETNIRQRGDVGGSAKKVGKRIKELERIYGIHQGNGSNQYEQKPNNSVIAKSQEDIAAQMGISVDTLQNYKMMAEMIPELEDLMDTGIVTKVRQCRNLTPIQRIAIAERKRDYYEKKAKENMRLAEGGDRRSESYEKKQGLANLSKVENPINVRAKLAETAGVSQDTYSKGKKILDSNNEEVKQKVMSGEMSINAGYNKNYCNS